MKFGIKIVVAVVLVITVIGSGIAVAASSRTISQGDTLAVQSEPIATAKVDTTKSAMAKAMLEKISDYDAVKSDCWALTTVCYANLIDVNGDGIDDLVIGMVNDDGLTGTCQAYIWNNDKGVLDEYRLYSADWVPAYANIDLCRDSQTNEIYVRYSRGTSNYTYCSAASDVFSVTALAAGSSTGKQLTDSYVCKRAGGTETIAQESFNALINRYQVIDCVYDAAYQHTIKNTAETTIQKLESML